MSNLHTYQQGLLRKYIDGTITSDERHELEKMALDDDMLFATLEGYSQSSETDHKATLNDLYEALSPTRSKRRIIPLAWMSAAAGLVLIAAIGFLIRQDQLSTSSPMEKSISMESAVMEEEVMKEAEILADATTLQSPQNQKDYVYDEEEPSDITFDQEMDLQVNKTKAALENEASANEGTSTIARGDENVPTPTLAKKAERDYIGKMDAAPAASDQDLADTPSREEITQEEIRSLPTKNISEIAATSAGLSTTDGDDDVSIRGSRGDDTNYYVDGIRVSQSSIPASEMNAESEDIIAKDQEQASSPLQQKSTTKSRKKSKTESIETTMDTALDLADSDTEMITLRGIIIDASHHGLIAANVYIENTDIGTMTDFDGNFELLVPNKEVALIVTYLGYEDLYYPFYPDDQPVTIQMKESSSLLDEVSIAAARSQSIDNAEPLMGYEQFEDYLNENFIKHKDCTRSSVKLSFTITEDGDVTDIANPIKDECFYEAKRLLQNAGKWKTMPARKEIRVDYTFRI